MNECDLQMQCIEVHLLEAKRLIKKSIELMKRGDKIGYKKYFKEVEYNLGCASAIHLNLLQNRDYELSLYSVYIEDQFMIIDVYKTLTQEMMDFYQHYHL